MSDKMIEIKKDNIIKKYIMKFDSIFENIFKSKGFNIIFFILGILVMIIYLSLYLYLNPIVDEEVRPEVTNNLIPWEVKEGESFIKAMLTRPFDLKITEEGQYRPRYLAFLVQFLDENIFLRVTRAMPIFGNRQPFYILSMFLTVFAMYYFINTIWKKVPKGFALFISSTILIFQNYQVATYWRARSAKLMTLAVAIFLITYAIRLLNSNITKKNFYKIFFCIPIFLLMTLDEQIIAIVIMSTALLILFSIINRKLNIGTIIYSISCILYASFHLWWGKALFLYFTGSLQKHGHTIEGSVNGLGIQTIRQSLEILINTIPKTIFLSIFIFIFVWIFCFCMLFINSKEKLKNKIKKGIIALFLSLTSIILLTLMIDAHSAIYELKCLWGSVYSLVPTIIMLLSLIYLIANSDVKLNGFKYLIFSAGIIISLVYNFFNINNYYGAYLIEKNGFRNDYSDLIVTNDDIIVNVYNSDKMNIDNQSFMAVLNTIFSTDNVYTTKILNGKCKDSNYIECIFSCYLINRKNRNLHLEVKLDDYTKFNSLSIIINNNEVKKIDINSEKIVDNIFITTEINRACKVTLKFDSKNNICDDNMIELQELYIE